MVPFGALRRPPSLRSFALLGVCLAAVLGCAPESAESPPVVLISIDTLRADRLPAYGYEGVATPHLDALRADSVLYERAYSPTPTTLPAHASMLTGLLPPEHGIRGNVGYTLDAERLGYLPALLRERGYATGAAVSSFVMRGETGFDGGFDLYEDNIDYHADAGSAGFQRRGPETLEAVLPWLRSVADGPFFLFLHLYEPHTPYAPPEPYASRYDSAYDGEIAAADEVVGDLVAELRELGVYDDAVIVVTSDHGEGLGDHGESEHGIFLYRESIEVPLFVKLPGGERRGESESLPAQLSDVYHTILGLAGADGAPSGGVSLLDLGAAGTERPIYSETWFPRFYFGWSELVSVIEGAHHYIDSPDPELYDLAADPLQQRNLLAEEPDTVRRMRGWIDRYERKLENPEDTDLETWQRLASLGYVGRGQTRVEGELPAPHTQKHLLSTIRSGLRQALEGNHPEAVMALSRVVEENPNALVAWEQLGSSFERMGRPAEARQAYLRALELSGEAPHLVLAAARTSLHSGELDSAAELAQRATAWDEAAARTLLGEIALAKGDLDQAESESRRALELRRPNSSAMFTIAQAQLRRGELDEALETTRQNEVEVGRPVPRLDLLRGNILASLGRFEEAEAALRRELENFPDNLATYPRLALFLARHGRPDEAVATVRLLVETHPDPAGYLAAVRALELLGDPAAAAALMNEARRRFPRELGSAAGGGAAAPG
jgi:arylsulfatase A-like enzyme/Tfp pilus assembly protein PilF